MSASTKSTNSEDKAMEIKRLVVFLVAVAVIGGGLLLPAVFKPAKEVSKTVEESEIVGTGHHHAPMTAEARAALGYTGPTWHSRFVEVPITEEICVADPVQDDGSIMPSSDGPGFVDPTMKWNLNDHPIIGGRPFSRNAIEESAGALWRTQNPNATASELRFVISKYEGGCEPWGKLTVEVFSIGPEPDTPPNRGH